MGRACTCGEVAHRRTGDQCVILRPPQPHERKVDAGQEGHGCTQVPGIWFGRKCWPAPHKEEPIACGVAALAPSCNCASVHGLLLFSHRSHRPLPMCMSFLDKCFSTTFRLDRAPKVEMYPTHIARVIRNAPASPNSILLILHQARSVLNLHKLTWHDDSRKSSID